MLKCFWVRYRAAVNIRDDIRAIYLRKHKRFATLDGARAITIMLMVFFHVLFGVLVLFNGNPDRIDIFIVSFPRYLGWLWQTHGSDPLFLLCGLLVSYTLFREYDRNGRINFIRFYKRRLMRIMPLFLVAILLFLPGDPDKIRYLWSNLIFMSNYIDSQSHMIPVGWSLDLQMHFYFLLPLVILLLYLTPRRIVFLSLLFVASVAWRYYIVGSNPELYERPFYEAIYDSRFGNLITDKLHYDLDVRFGAFVLGMLVAYLHHYYHDNIKTFLTRQVVVSNLFIIVGLALIAGSLSIPIENRFSDFYQDFNPTVNFWYLVLNRYLYSLGLAMVLILVLCPAGLAHQVNRVLCWKIWRPFAQLIYPIYLFHFIFIVIAAAITFGTTDRDAITEIHTLQVFIIYFWTVILTLLFSTLVHVFVEKPFLTMRDSDAVTKPAEKTTQQIPL